MAKKVDFYRISLNNNLGITNYSMREFLESIEQKMFVDDGMKTLVRKIGEKYIRIFRYYYTTTHRQFVIPFGKLKNKNVPYWENEKHQLETVPIDLYDVNSLGYDSEYDVMVFTTNREGPTIQDIEEYLNTFISPRAGLFVKMEPIMHNTGIEKIRNAELVRSVTLNLNLWQPLNNFFMNEIDGNNQGKLLAALRGIAVTAKDIGDSRTLSLTLGLGQGTGKDATLDLESILFMLEQMNVDADFVKEIQVNYKNGRDDKIDTARIKQSQILLFYNCKCNGNQVTPQALLDNINDAVAEKVAEINRHTRIYFANRIQYAGNEIEIITNWNNDVE